jgi:dihydrofolate synthase/folylpolyglutamate synthase
MTALTLFQIFGFYSEDYYKALNNIQWPGRMQRLEWPGLKCPLYISGDHNEQGVQSLIEILNDFQWQNLYLVIGIGVDKDATMMLKRLCELKNVKLCLTETPFKGRKLSEYPEVYFQKAFVCESNCIKLLNQIVGQTETEDLVLVTGSLYLVGLVLEAVIS